MVFETSITLTGPPRRPIQLLALQHVDGQASVHDADSAFSLGLAGAPIEGPTHFSQFDPLAYLLWSDAWFERGCISAHFQAMVVEGEAVQASLTRVEPYGAEITASKDDGTPVLTGTASLGPTYGDTATDRGRAALRDPGELFILDRLRVGMTASGGTVSISHDHPNGDLYPFSLDEKLAAITEPHPWYTRDGGATSPWGRPILPMEMISVLANRSGDDLPVRRPSVGLFLDLEIRVLGGPLFIDDAYSLEREVIGLSASRRTESYWTKTLITDVATAEVVAEVVLHQGVFKASYPGYPSDRLHSS